MQLPTKVATPRCTALTPRSVPSSGSNNSDSAIPTGQEFIKIAIAVAISCPENQSVTIFVNTTLIITAPAPAASRPAICNGHEGASAISTPPASMRASAPITVALSPSR